jgi:N-acetylglucosamine-6-phosphate deacetylase
MEQRIFCPRLFDGRTMHHNMLLCLRAGKVEAVLDEQAAGTAFAELRLAPGSLIAPGLIDTQVNGGGGVLFNDRPDLQSIALLAQAHRAQGTTSLLPTLITDTREHMAQGIAAVRDACAAVPGVLGIHLEGPFLQVARRGIHRQQHIATWDNATAAADLQLLGALGDGGRTLVTLAPECVPAGTIRALRQRGVLVFAGHTEASFEQMQLALDEGLDGFTHLFNAMSQLTGRAPGAVGAALLADKAYAGLILDGHHVASGSVAVLRAARGMQRVILVSDAMSVAGTTATEFELLGKRIRVQEGRCVDDSGTLAGSAITLADAVRMAITHYGVPVELALASASRVPAELLGLTETLGVLQAGARADAVVFDADFNPSGVLQDGAWVRAPEPVA